MTAVPPIRREVLVDADPAAAFEVFTGGIGRWWPLDELSVHGGDATVFSPVGGPPFVTDLDRGRRYGTLEDLHNFIKLAHSAPAIHFSGGSTVEPIVVILPS